MPKPDHLFQPESLEFVEMESIFCWRFYNQRCLSRRRGGWSRLLQARLAESWLDIRVLLKSVNLAVDGSTAVDWSHSIDAKLAESLVDTEVPRLVVLMLGVNDCVGFHDKRGLSLLGFQSAMRSVIKRVLALSSVQALLLLKPLPIGCKSYGVENSDLRPYADFYDQLAVLDPRITVLDTFSLHLNAQDYVDWDGLHPGPTGHQKVCEYVEPVINRLLAKLA